MTTPVSPSQSTPHEPSSESSSVASISTKTKIELLPEKIYDPVKEKINTIDVKFSAIVALFQFSNQLHQQSDDLVNTCESLMKERNELEALKKIHEFVNSFLKTQTDPIFNQEKNNKYLVQKISKILIDSEINLSSKKEILRHLLEDFMITFEKAQQRVSADLSSGILGIAPDDVVTSIEALGSETHQEGKIPLLLTFKSGGKIVYKPRSMLAEQMICSKENSLFAAAGLGTYGVVCLKDAKGDYGYCEHLTNTESENTMNSLEEIKEYFEKLAKLEQICLALGISDVHYQNIITHKKIPYLIDAESFLNPDFMPTGIYADNGAANTFDMYKQDLKKIEGKNKIWFNPSLTKAVKSHCFDFEMQEKDLKAIGVDITLKAPPLSTEVQAKVRSTQKALCQYNGRYVLASTQELTSLLPLTDPNDPSHLNHFLGIVQHNLAPHFQYVEGSDKEILSKFQADVFHNDTPSFYYNSLKEEILYEGIVIAKRL